MLKTGAKGRAADTTLNSCPSHDRHPRRGGVPHQLHFCGGESVGFVDEVAEGAFELGGFDGLSSSARHSFVFSMFHLLFQEFYL